MSPTPPGRTHSVSFDVIGGPTITLTDFRLVVAGYTGRDERAVRQHISELAEIGVPEPDSVPTFYPLAPGLLSQSPEITVAGVNTSGEVEPVLVRHHGQLFLGVGSDHTDRDLERASVAESKAACPKPVSRQLVAVPPSVEWDAIELISTCDGRPYQQGSLASLLPPVDVLGRYESQLGEADDIVLFGGTVPLLDGEFIAADEWEMTLTLPGGESVSAAYRVTLAGYQQRGA